MSYVPTTSTNNGMGCISTDGNTSALFAETGIVLSGNLLTTPITATIGQSGISTTNPNGFNILNTLNLNSNNITNVGTITATNLTSGTITNSGETINGSSSQLLINNNSSTIPAISAPNAQLISFPNANVSATTFTGALSGNATTATTATKVNVSTISTNTPFSVCFTTDGGSGSLAIDDSSTSNNFTYNPSTSTLNAYAITCNGGILCNTGQLFLGNGGSNGIQVSGASSFINAVTFSSTITVPTINYTTALALQYNGTTQLSTSSTGINIPNNLTLTTSTTNNSFITFSDTSTSNAVTLKYVNYSSSDYFQISPSNSNSSLTIGGIIPTTANAWNTIASYAVNTQTFNIGSGSGTSQLVLNSNGCQATLLTTQGTATYTSSTLTFVTTASAPYPTYYNNIITISGSTTAQSVTTITPPTNMPVGACYTCYITNSNTSAGSVTFNPSGLGTGIKTTYTGGVIVPISGFAIATLTKVGSATYIFSINLVA